MDLTLETVQRLVAAASSVRENAHAPYSGFRVGAALLLPDGEIDLVFLCNTYHHIDEQIAYFDRLRTDLKPTGRLAIVEPRGIFLVRRLLPAHHWSNVDELRQEMAEAHYRRVAGFDFLPLQSFEIFAPDSD